MKCQESIQKTMIFGLEKRRSKLDKEFNRKKKVKITWSEIEKNQAKWENFLVCKIKIFQTRHKISYLKTYLNRENSGHTYLRNSFIEIRLTVFPNVT